MSVLVGFRNTNPPSASRPAYGNRGGTLIFPLDIVFASFNPDTMPAGTPFLGTEVDGAGFVIGTIAAYTWPLVGAVTPIVEVTPDPGLDLSAVTTLPPGPPASVADGTSVSVVNQSGSVIMGTVHPLTTLSYLDLSHTITAYTVTFNPPLHPDDHGLPVVLADGSGTVVGMVISTQLVTGMPNTFVVPV